MSQFFQVHPDNPQKRLIAQAAEILVQGGVVAFPTDSAYAIGCQIGNKKAADRIRKIRQLDNKHNFTLICRDLSEISLYAKVDNSQYRTIKSHTPGAYTFILRATNEVPRRLLHPKRREIGLRIPDNAIVLALVEELGEPLMSSTLILPAEQDPMTDPYEIRSLLEHELDLVIDGGFCGFEPTTVVNLVETAPVILRQGKGDASTLESS